MFINEKLYFLESIHKNYRIVEIIYKNFTNYLLTNHRPYTLFTDISQPIFTDYLQDAQTIHALNLFTYYLLTTDGKYVY